MEGRFRKCLETMLTQIDKNNQNNAQLAQSIVDLRTEISESKKDIGLIEDYMRSKGKQVAKVHEMCPPLRGLSRKGSNKDLFNSLSASKRLLRMRSPGRVGEGKVLLKS